MANINNEIINVDNLRIKKLSTYCYNIIDTLLTNTDYQINANMLSADINNYSIDKIPTASIVQEWINGQKVCRDVYSFRSRNSYSQNDIDNLMNVGFFEIFEQIINSNNNKGILPEIEGIISISCLNCGSMIMANTDTAEFDIQIQIEYII